MITRLWHRLSPARGHDNLSIRTKVLLPPLAAITILGPLLYVHFESLDRRHAIAADRIRQEQAVLVEALTLPEHLLEVNVGLYRLGLESNASGVDADLEGARTSVERALAGLSDKASALTASGLAGAEVFGRALGAYGHNVERTLERIERAPVQGREAVRQTQAQFEELTRRAETLVTQTSRALERLKAEEVAARRTTRGDVLRIVIASLLVLLVASLSSRSIALPLERLLTAIRHLRQGDLERTISMTDRRDEFGEVARAIARLRTVLIERQSLEEERERERRALDHMAHHDTLTGLPNRPSLQDFLTRAFEDRRRERLPLALLVVDLDGFKPTNDTYGHAAGDAVLVEIAHRLHGVIREGDIAARTGGDEFSIVFSRVQAREDMGRLAARVAEVFDPPIEWEGRSLMIGGSIGAALTTDTGCDGDALFAAADEAMYTAKQEPDRRWVLHVPPGEAEEERESRTKLEQAIRSNEIIGFYQPIARLSDGRRAGYTVHLYWKHPHRGIVPIGRFLPEVEKAGLVGEMTVAGFRTLLRTTTAWLDEGLEPGWMSIVPPAAMLLSPGAMCDFDRVLSEFPDAAARLVIEVPEVFLEERAERAILKSLRCLRVRQVRTAIGGFGRRAGSLALLRKGAFDEVRISSSLISTYMADREVGVLVGGYLGVAEGLGLDVLARGVQTADQERRLRRLGCRFASGPRYGPRMDEGAAREQMRRLAPPSTVARSA